MNVRVTDDSRNENWVRWILVGFACGVNSLLKQLRVRPLLCLVAISVGISASCIHRGAATAPATPAAAPAAPVPAPVATPAPALPASLSDDAFWQLTTDLSEPGGTFRSDNLLSNELWLQAVIPDLLAAVKPGRVYLGVGPEQNFTYIAALKPAMAFIIDIRRGNLDLHLMYKALFELSADRADFVARLFARPRPDGLTTNSTADEIFRAVEQMPADPQRFEQDFTAVIDNLTKTHHFVLEPEDLPGIRYVYMTFAQSGPDLTYSMSSGGYGGRGFGGGRMPSYAQLMAAEDGNGVNRSYLASDENFRVLKTLEGKNLLVPVVGNFAGAKAIRAAGDWIRGHGSLVAAFYLSNVEQYLVMDQIWTLFCQNSATLPIDDSSYFIRSARGGAYGGPGGYAGSLSQDISPMRKDLSSCAASGDAFARAGRSPVH